jgi:hypothetical protein
MLMLTDKNVLHDMLLEGDPENRIAPIRIRHEENITPIEPYEYGTFIAHIYNLALDSNVITLMVTFIFSVS